MNDTTLDDLNHIANSHLVTSKIKIYSAAGTLVAESGTFATANKFALIDGDVTVDRRQAHRRSFTAQCADNNQNVFDGTLPIGIAYRNIVKVYRGYLTDASISGIAKEWLLGTFLLETFTPSEDVRGVPTYTLAGRDVSAYIAENPWLEPFHVTAAQSVQSALVAMVNDRQISTMPSPSIAANAYQMPNNGVYYGGNYDNNPWQEMQQIADAAKMEIWADLDGKIKAAPYYSIGASVITFANSAPRLMLTGPVTRPSEWSRSHNGVVVRVNAPWLLTPVVAEAYILSGVMSSSGPMGKRPIIIERSSIFNYDQALEVAASKLTDLINISEEIFFEILPVPGLEAGDTCSVTATSIGLSNTYALIDAFNIPLTYGRSCTVTARKALT